MSEKLSGPTNAQIVEAIQPDLEVVQEARDSDPLSHGAYLRNTQGKKSTEMYGGLTSADQVRIKRNGRLIERVDANVAVPTASGQLAEYHAHRTQWPGEYAGTTVKRPGYEAHIKNPRAVELVTKLAAKSVANQVKATKVREANRELPRAA